MDNAQLDILLALLVELIRTTNRTDVRRVAKSLFNLLSFIRHN